MRDCSRAADFRTRSRRAGGRRLAVGVARKTGTGRRGRSRPARRRRSRDVGRCARPRRHGSAERSVCRPESRTRLLREERNAGDGQRAGADRGESGRNRRHVRRAPRPRFRPRPPRRRPARMPRRKGQPSRAPRAAGGAGTEPERARAKARRTPAREAIRPAKSRCSSLLNRRLSATGKIRVGPRRDAMRCGCPACRPWKPTFEDDDTFNPARRPRWRRRLRVGAVGRGQGHRFRPSPCESRVGAGSSRRQTRRAGASRGPRTRRP